LSGGNGVRLESGACTGEIMLSAQVSPGASAPPASSLVFMYRPMFDRDEVEVVCTKKSAIKEKVEPCTHCVIGVPSRPLGFCALAILTSPAVQPRVLVDPVWTVYSSCKHVPPVGPGVRGQPPVVVHFAKAGRAYKGNPRATHKGNTR